ncbi:MAG TPA: DUF4349 domain-containing protein [Halobacteriales archaeon]|nr:DUF4349 domain-containing protein [Halobacteriales archaeon]
MSHANNQHELLTIGLVLLVVLAGCAGASGGGGAGPPDRTVGGAPAAGSNDDPSPDGSFYVGDRRVVVRQASMGLEVRQFDSAFDRARATVRDHGGFVADWELDVERGWHRATLQIRVPAANFSPVRDKLADLGTVERERVDAEDFTTEHEDLDSTLSDLREREETLVARLEAAETETTARRTRAKLDDVRSRIRSTREERSNLERRAGLSSIELTLHEPESARTPPTYERATGFGHAFLGAFYGGLAIVKYVVAAVGFVIPVGLTLVALGATVLVSVRLTGRFWSDLDATLRDGGLGSIGGGGSEKDGAGGDDDAGEG